MRPPNPAQPAADAAYVDRLASLAEPYGITRWGVASADVLQRAREALIERAGAGLADSMQFTYRDPIRSTDPRRAVHGARSILVMARPYRTEPGAEADGSLRGRIARYAWSDTTGELRAGLWAVARQLRADRWKAVAYADDNSVVDREVAYRAGLGWFGKNANLLIRGAGSWFVLGCVVTTAPLPVASATVADGCGTCTRCITACPTAAIVAPGVVDARRCLSWLLQRPGSIDDQFRAAIGTRLYGCDDCQEVCPPTVYLGRRSAITSDAAGGGPQQSLDLIELLRAADDDLLARWGRWYLAERDPRWIRRNALIALGNALHTGDVGAAESVLGIAVLNEYRHSDDPILAEHARWALSRAEAISDRNQHRTTP